MPYTPPSTVTGSDVLTASLWNTQIRDNFEALNTQITDNFEEVKNPVSCEVARTTDVTAGTDISWEVANWDTSPTPMWTLATFPRRVFIRESGLYLIVFKVVSTFTPAPIHVQQTISVNGTKIDAQINRAVGIGTSTEAHCLNTFTTLVPLNVNDYIGANVFTDYQAVPVPSPTHTVSGRSVRNDAQTRLSVTRISAIT